ncbi:MAG: acyltransferase [Pseudomonadota bacterium]
MNFIEEFRQNHTRSELRKLKSIQALRAIAAIAVMFAHLYGIEARQPDATPLLPGLIRYGMAGVDLFFVISGFIMVWVAGDWQPGRSSSLAFLYARATRIYPTWWLFAGALSVYFWITLGVPWDPAEVTPTQMSGAEHLIKSVFLIPQDILPVLQLGWTLVHEMYFYLGFALILLLPRAWRLPAMGAWASLIIAAIIAGHARFHATTLLGLVFHPMSLEFLMGAAVGWVIKAGWTKYARPVLALGLIGLISSIWTVNMLSIDQSLPVQRTLIIGTAAACVVYGLVALELRNGASRWAFPALVRIGDWSYSLYLCHILVIAGVARLYYPVYGQETVAAKLGYLVLASLAAIAVAGLSYSLFERPMIRVFRRWRPTQNLPPQSAQRRLAE